MQKISISTSGQLAEIILARLSHFAIDGVEEKEDVIDVYVQDNLLQDAAFKAELKFLEAELNAAFTIAPMKQQNWNAQWEASYQPVTIEGQVRVRASFHDPDPQFVYDIVIDPKMAFGTGHHPTTTLMMARMLQHDFNYSSVLDMGCGTGVLAILAGMLGASRIDAIDIDPWSFENAQQNAALNGIDNMQVIKGSVKDIPDVHYDFILANINREIIGEHLHAYRQHMALDGKLITSGFFTADEHRLMHLANEYGLQATQMIHDGDWLLLEFKATDA
jgi:ribosomal protein L11 methyltransferase